MFDGLKEWIRVSILRYETTTALYMLEPWEKVLFNATLVSFVAMSTYTTYVYLPPFVANVVSAVGLSS